MEIYKKLNKVKEDLRKAAIKPTGDNKYAGYKYLELQDFLPLLQESLQNNNLFSRFEVTRESMLLYIYNIDAKETECIEYTVPLEKAEMKGLHPVQNLGATITYLKRYLYMLAFDISEHDALDSSEPVEDKTITQVVDEVSKCANLKHLKNIFTKYQKIFTGEELAELVDAKEKAKQRLTASQS